MTTIQEGIVNALSGLRENQTIYVLKGFNQWIDSINGKFLFGKRPLLEPQANLGAVSAKLSSGEPFFALHEDITWLAEQSLGGLPRMHGYNLVVVENDAFYIYYPDYGEPSWSHEAQELFNRDTDNIIQRYYGDVSTAESGGYVAYNDLVGVERIEVLLSSICDFSASLSEDTIELPEEYDAIAYATRASDSKLTNNVIEQKLGASATTRNYNTTKKLVELTA